MTKEEIYKMVKKSDLGFLLGDNWMMHQEFEYFAKLVAENERKACVKVCEKLQKQMTPIASLSAFAYSTMIKARGE